MTLRIPLFCVLITGCALANGREAIPNPPEADLLGESACCTLQDWNTLNWEQYQQLQVRQNRAAVESDLAQVQVRSQDDFLLQGLEGEELSLQLIGAVREAKIEFSCFVG